MYKVIVEYNRKHFQIRCLLDFEGTSFAISPKATNGFQIEVTKRCLPAGASDMTGRMIYTARLYNTSLGVALSDHISHDIEVDSFNVVKPLQEYDAFMPSLVAF